MVCGTEKQEKVGWFISKTEMANLSAEWDSTLPSMVAAWQCLETSVAATIRGQGFLGSWTETMDA